MTMYVWLCMYGYVCMATYDYVCMAMHVWLCMYDYVCMTMYVWLCIYGYVWLCMAMQAYVCMYYLWLCKAMSVWLWYGNFSFPSRFTFQFIRKAIDLEPANPIMWNTLGVISASQGPSFICCGFSVYGKCIV